MAFANATKIGPKDGGKTSHRHANFIELPTVFWNAISWASPLHNSCGKQKVKLRLQMLMRVRAAPPPEPADPMGTVNGNDPHHPLEGEGGTTTAGRKRIRHKADEECFTCV